MTKETRYLFQLSDVKGVEFTCLKDSCKTRITLEPRSRRDRESLNCPGCGQSWAELDSPLHTAYGKLFSAMRTIAEHEKTAKAELRLEIDGVDSKNDAK
jgi:hypothetical protein